MFTRFSSGHLHNGECERIAKEDGKHYEHVYTSFHDAVRGWCKQIGNYDRPALVFQDTKVMFRYPVPIVKLK